MEKRIGDKVFEIRPLTRGELRSLRKSGYNLVALDISNAEDAMDAVLEMVFKDRVNEIYNLPNPDAIEIFKAILELTYGGAAEKNFLTTGDGTPQGS
jgi:hypothetical protein